MALVYHKPTTKEDGRTVTLDSLVGRKVLVVGSGGREHAIVDALSRSACVEKIYCAPGNAGIAAQAECVPIKETDIPALVDFASEKGIDLTVVGPEVPLSLGIADAFAAAGLRIFGPSAAAARIESSKDFAKRLMAKYDVPTAAYRTFDKFGEALEYVLGGKFPVVLKYDGLAAGKGVVIPETPQEAEEALRDMLLDDRFGKGKVVVEEFLTGPEFSFMCFVDGTEVYPLALSQDHKRAFDGDKGPNTGGMGAYSPLPFISREDEEFALEHIMKKVAAGMVSEGCPFKGVLYGGLMKTPEGIKVIEFNCRFGDPETEVVLPRLQTDIYGMFSAVADGNGSMPELRWSDDVVLGFVMASKGYPGSYEKGFEISGIEDAMSDPAVRIYQMGTRAVSAEDREHPVLVTSGGRVLMVVASAPTAPEARDKALAAVGKIRCDNLFNRTDIGHWIF
ncbi:MAG: phosphoribosylamine--glycine ligase [Candidatus Cryptobacteroides sp.]